MTTRHAVVIGVAAGLTMSVVVALLSVAVYVMVGGPSPHSVDLDRDGRPTYTTVP